MGLLVQLLLTNMEKIVLNKQNTGQTLIETMVAVFMLVMGVTASVGLAIFAFNSSTTITKQIIATGLAREGVEAIKNMRDTNWNKDTLSNTCYNYSTGVSDASCYKGWLKPSGAPALGNGFDITQPSGGKSIRLNIDGSAGSDLWNPKSDTANWGLDFNPTLSTTNFYGFYGSNNINTGSLNGTSEFYRQILITEDSSGLYNHNEFHKLVIESRVWWTDKKCPRVQTWPGNGKCSVSIQTNLTNWKDY